MIISITGTPGTGKTTVSELLRKNGFNVINLNDVAIKKNFLIGKDKKRDSFIVDIKKIDEYIKKNYGKKNIIFVEGHLSHLLRCVDKVIILRCHPDKLKKNLSSKGWDNKKIKENIEAEILDVILCEAADLHDPKNIFEINTTNKSVNDVFSSIIEIIENKFKN
ncbi:MAG: adenylate kinase family protein, partial [Thermoplasmatota archaeon]